MFCRTFYRTFCRTRSTDLQNACVEYIYRMLLMLQSYNRILNLNLNLIVAGGVLGVLDVLGVL